MICRPAPLVAVAAAWCCLSGPAVAATKGGVTMPDTMQVAGTTLQLNGMGVRSFTFMKIRGYVAGLYLTSRTSDAAQALAEPGPKALVMQFVRGAPKAKVHDLYMDSSKAYCARHDCTASDKASFEALLGTVQDVKPGDRTGFIVSDAGVKVMFNDAVVTTIADPAFGRTIIDSDLGTTTPSIELRDGLLGKDD